MALPEIGELGFVNHHVTLLRNNRTLQKAGDIDCGQEFFIDERHKTLLVSSGIQTVLDTLFGSKPERCYFNVRMFQLLQVIHSTEFAPLITEKWPRISYNIDSTEILEAPFGEITTTSILDPGQPAVSLSVVGDLIPDHDLGRLLQSWIVKVQLNAGFWGTPYAFPWGGFREVKITNLLDGSSELIQTEDTNVFPLKTTAPAEQVLFLRFATAASDVPLGTHTVAGLANPVEDLVTVEKRIRELGEDTLDEVFTGAADEIVLGKQLFENHIALPYRLTGLMLALIFKLEEVRLQGSFVFESAA